MMRHPGQSDLWRLLNSASYGTVTSPASHLCHAAEAEQVVVPQRIDGALEVSLGSEAEGSLKGWSRPVPMYNLVGLSGTLSQEREAFLTC